MLTTSCQFIKEEEKGLEKEEGQQSILKNTLDCGSLRARQDTSKEKLRSEGSFVKGSRMRNPVPLPVAAEDLWLTQV